MFGRRKADVLVVGGGPAGLFTALLLVRDGIAVRVLDMDRRSGRHRYALALHGRSLDLLGEVGLADDLIANGQRIERVAFYEGAQRRFEISLAEPDRAHGFVLVIPQYLLEDALERQLRREGVSVQWNHRVEGLHLGEDTVGVDVAVLDQVSSGYPIARMEWVTVKKQRIEAPFLVGADGYHSFVRHELGIEFRELSGREAFHVFEFDAPKRGGAEACAVFDGQTVNALWPMRDRRWRWCFQADEDGQAQPPLERLNALIRRRAPWFPAVEGPLHWESMVHFDRRLAARFGQGRAWLAGDAAHLTLPMGNQSMNGGLVDAQRLSRCLSGALRGGEAPDTLAEYDGERLRAWDVTLGLGGRLDFGDHRWLATVGPRFLAAVPATGEDLVRLIAQAGMGYKPPSTSANA